MLRPAEGSPDLTAWRERQEAERERIRKLDHTPLVRWGWWEKAMIVKMIMMMIWMEVSEKQVK